MPGGNILELQESSEVLLCHDAAVPWGSERQIAESVCELSQAQAHTHAHLIAPAEIHPETQGSAQCLLPGALGCLGAEAEQNRAVPQHKSHCSCPSLKWRKQH